jgi:hypothetical protein
MADRNLRRPGRYITFRLHDPERQLLQDLGRVRPGVDDRYAALRNLIPIVEHLEMTDVRERDRRPLRLRIPEDLDQAINRKAGETGQTFLAVLIAAATEYRRRHADEHPQNP